MSARFPRGPASLVALIPLILPPALPAQNLVQFRNAAPGVAYVGSKACEECHSDIYESYLRTDMGRAMSLPSERDEVRAIQSPIALRHPTANRVYQVFRSGSGLFQSESEPGADGKEVFRNTHRVEYLIGSGANGFGCIVRRGDFLFEAPLSYYTKANAWGLSPGYEFADYGFNRPIREDCIQCHSGRAQPLENGKYKDPPFAELAIGCENCHGPGALHVEERRKAAPFTGRLDRSIVNPAKLPGWLADNICMACHQGADVRALLPGKSYSDFRPGTPLTDTFAIFAVPFRRDAPPSDPLLQHFALMSQSRCYLKSGGRLACITCHDPHRQPGPAEAPATYRSKCLSCHTEKSCTLPYAARMDKTPPNDCAGCHMPKQNLQKISHSSLTNHRILARVGEPLPESAFHQTARDLPDLVHLNAIPQATRSAFPPLTLFRAYGELMGSHPESRERFEAVLASLAKSKSQDRAVLSALGRRKMTEGTAEANAAATHYFEEALRAGSTDAYDIELLATLLAKARRTQDVIETLRRGLELDPYSPRLYKLLAAQYVSLKDYDDALKTLKKELELFPEDALTRSLIEKAEHLR